MKIMAISFILIIFIHSGSAFEFTSPESISVEERFEIEIFPESEEHYDVKIYIHNSSDDKITRGEIISEIFEEVWRDPWTYIKDSLPSQKIYEVRLIEGSGKMQICVNLRKTGKTNYEKSCKEITIKKDISKEVDEEAEMRVSEEIKKDESEDVVESSEEIKKDEEPQLEDIPSISGEVVKNIENPKIVLRRNQEVYEKKEVTKYLLYGFLFIFLFVFFAILFEKI